MMMLFSLVLEFQTSSMQDAKVRDLIRRGDDYGSRRETPGMAKASVESFQEALAPDETCVQAYWKIVRSGFWIGDEETEEKKKEAIFREGPSRAPADGRRRDPQAQVHSRHPCFVHVPQLISS